jgi:predicted lipase
VPGGLLVTGHGLGGAVASLMAADLKISFPSELSRVRCVTFGSPKVFTESSAKIVKELRIESIRVQLEDDLKSKSEQRGFHHVSSDVIYVVNGVYIWVDGKEEIPLD